MLDATIRLLYALRRPLLAAHRSGELGPELNFARKKIERLIDVLEEWERGSW